MILKCALLSILHLVTVSGQFNRRAISVDKKTARLSPSNVDGGGMNYAGYAVKSIIDSMEDDLHDRSFKDNKDPLMENTMRDNPDYVVGNSELEGHDGPSFKPMVSAVDSVNYLEDDHHDHSSEDNKDLLWKNTMEDHREDLFGVTDLTLVEDDHGESSVEDNLVLKDEMDIQSASQNRKLRRILKSEKKVKDGKKSKLNNGDPCSLDDDCVSNRCDNSSTCNDKLLDGDSCAYSNNCQTGLCNNMFSCGRRSDGSNCLVDNDCTKGNCNGVFSCGTLNNGNICISDSDCTSDRCGWSFSCQSKLNNDELCWNDGDCKNGRCLSNWSGYYCN